MFDNSSQLLVGAEVRRGTELRRSWPVVLYIAV